MISPALRICIQPARARLALAGGPVRPKPEQMGNAAGLAGKTKSVNQSRIAVCIARVWGGVFLRLGLQVLAYGRDF
jgi:hypothetical protein